LGVETIRDASPDLLGEKRSEMADGTFRCAKHIVGEIQRAQEANNALASGDLQHLGQLMFASHDSSRDDFRNSCPQLDQLVDFARHDHRCAGARLSGGGFGGITIHLVPAESAEAYRKDILQHHSNDGAGRMWSAVCQIDNGAAVMP